MKHFLKLRRKSVKSGKIVKFYRLKHIFEVASILGLCESEDKNCSLPISNKLFLFSYSFN